MVSAADWQAVWLSLELASVTTLVLLLIGTPLAWWLATTKWRFKFLIETLVALPLVLPPTVLGFYLLIAMRPNSLFSQSVENVFGFSLAFSFTGLVIGSVVYSLPFVVQPLQNAFQNISQRSFDVAASLGASPIDQFFSIAMPLAKPGFFTAAILGFAHTLGEFGVVLMIGGNIPGETQVASIAIYQHVESLAFAQAHAVSLILLLISFVLLAAIYAFGKSGRGLRL